LKKTNKNNIYSSTIILATIALSALTTPILAQADTLEVLREERSALDGEINHLTRSIGRTERQLEQMEGRFEWIESRIAQTKEDIETLEKRIETRGGIIDNRLSSLQVNGGKITYFEVLFGSQGFGDFINRVTTVNTILRSDQELIQSQKEDQERLDNQKERLNGQIKRLEEQFKSLQEKQSELESQKAEQELLALDLDDEIKVAEERAYWERYANLQSRRFVNLPIDELGKSYRDLSDDDKERIDESDYENRQSIIQDAIKEAEKYIGQPYVWGGSTPSTGFDCSGLTQWAFGEAGINLDRTAAQQYMQTDRVNPEDVRVGDLVFFSYGNGISHVGIYVGGGKMLNSQNSGVMIADLAGHWEQHIAGFGRIPGL